MCDRPCWVLHHRPVVDHKKNHPTSFSRNSFYQSQTRSGIDFFFHSFFHVPKWNGDSSLCPFSKPDSFNYQANEKKNDSVPDTIKPEIHRMRIIKAGIFFLFFSSCFHFFWPHFSTSCARIYILRRWFIVLAFPQTFFFSFAVKK